MRPAGKLFDCARALEGCFNACVLSCLEFCALALMSSAECYLGLLEKVVRVEEKLCEGKLCCLGNGRKISALCLLCKIYHKVGHPSHEYLHHLVAARNIRSAALGELAVVIPHYRTDQFSPSFQPTAVRLTCCRRMCLVVAP